MTDFNRTDSTEILAFVDIGANSVRMNIYEVENSTGKFRTVSSSRSMLGLAKYAVNGALSGDGEGKLYTVLREFLAKANAQPCDRFIAFATASLRGLSNSDAVLSRIKNGLGIDVEIIDGQREASLDYRAICEKFGEQMANRGIVIDMGGGSTELIGFDSRRIHHITSLDFGCLKLYKSFVGGNGGTPFPTDAECDRIAEYVRARLNEVAPLLSFGGTAYLIGGTARAMARLDSALHGGDDISDGYTISDASFIALRKATQNDVAADAALIKKVAPDRLISIVPGIVALTEILSQTGVSSAKISFAGVREGYLYELIGKSRRAKAPEF